MDIFVGGGGGGGGTKINIKHSITFEIPVYTWLKFNIWLGGFPGRIDALQACSILLESGEPVLVLVDGVLHVHATFRLLRRFSPIAGTGSTVRCAVSVVSAAAERTVQATHRRPTRAEQKVGSAAVLLAGYTTEEEKTTMNLT